MKKTISAALLLSALALAVVPSFAAVADAETKDPAPEIPPLGVYSVDFESEDDINKFDLYSSFGEGFKLLNGCLWTNRSGEQKAILREMSFTDLTIQADFVTPVKNAYLDGGFYIGVNGNIGIGVDCINAYQVCVLRGGTHSVEGGDYHGCTVKIYKFTYRDGVSNYRFIKECSAVATSDISVRACVKGNDLSVYVCGNEDAAMTYTMPDYTGGRVGFRAFYCQMGFDDLKIYSSSLEADTSALDGLIQSAENAGDGYTEQSSTALERAVTEARSARESGNQDVIDAACVKLERAIAALTNSHDRAALDRLIERAENTDGDAYTENSYASLLAVLTAAKNVEPSADEQTVSAVYERLSECLDDLTPLIGKEEE